MNIFPTVDLAAPVWVSPLTRRLVTLDSSLGSASPSLIEMAEPTSDVEALKFAEAGEVLDWLGILEGDLHCVAKDKDGRAILTTWMDLEVFGLLAADAQGTTLGTRFKQAHDMWLAAGAGLVHIDFYALEKEEAAALTG